MLVSCLKCYKEFDKKSWEVKRTKNKNFCSRTCSTSYYRSSLMPNPPIDRICTKCKKTFNRTPQHKSKVRCYDCVYTTQSNDTLTLGELKSRLSNKGVHPSWLNAQVRNHARRKHKHLLSAPCRCGYATHVELCHIKAISLFPDFSTIGEINNESNVVQLCRNCHWEFDHGMLNISSA
jgi:hypothetical protein